MLQVAIHASYHLNNAATYLKLIQGTHRIVSIESKDILMSTFNYFKCLTMLNISTTLSVLLC